MFSSSYSADPFQQFHFPSPFTSISSPPPPLLSSALDDNSIFLHHPDLLSGDQFLPGNVPEFYSYLNMEGSDKDSSPPPLKKNVDKDKHRKVCTAIGPRHRRVRLSIGISRKFFGLQDMLGFDKASETLEWLLNKSSTAIGELEESSCTEGTTKSGTFSTGSESLETNEAVSKEKPVWWRFREAIARESRANARARARARTREKMCIRKHEESERFSDSTLPLLSKFKSDSAFDELRSYSHIKMSFLKLDPEIGNPNFHQVVPQMNQAKVKKEKMEDIGSSATPSSYIDRVRMDSPKGFQAYCKYKEVYDKKSTKDKN